MESGGSVAMESGGAADPAGGGWPAVDDTDIDSALGRAKLVAIIITGSVLGGVVGAGAGALFNIRYTHV